MFFPQRSQPTTVGNTGKKIINFYGFIQKTLFSF
jgi:hypothetical protein